MTRSEVMARVRSKDTTPELTVRGAVHAAGFRFRLHQRTLPGSPDLVFASRRIVVFVNGCFWHGHYCKDGKRPASNSEYWNRKIGQNVARDKKNSEVLRKMGWKPIVIWTCRLNPGLRRLLRELRERSQ
jgi:DNA mismatch endonuclease, patch repair protein